MKFNDVEIKVVDFTAMNAKVLATTSNFDISQYGAKGNFCPIFSLKTKHIPRKKYENI